MATNSTNQLYGPLNSMGRENEHHWKLVNTLKQIVELYTFANETVPMSFDYIHDNWSLYLSLKLKFENLVRNQTLIQMAKNRF